MNLFFQGFLDCFKAHKVVAKNGMLWVYIIPIVFSSIMVFTLFKLSDDMVSSIALPILDYFGFESVESAPELFWDKMKYWLRIAGEYTIYGVLYLMCFFVYYKIQKYIVLIAMAPVIAYVSEKSEEILMGNTYDFKMGLFVKDIWRGIRIALRNLFLELLLIVLIGLAIAGISALFSPLALIATPVSAILIFTVSAYYYGYSSFDYLNERQRLSVSAGNRLIWDKKLLAIGNGSVFGLLILIPFIGIVFAPVLCPVGAVISAKKLKLYEQKKAAL